MKTLLRSSLFILVIISSCNQNRNESLLYIKNSTGFEIEVDYKESSANFYPSTTEKNASYLEKSFKLKDGTSRLIFYEAKFINRPSELISKYFNLIKLNINKDEVIISQNINSNYKKNIFTEDNAWVFEKIESSKPTMFRENPVTQNIYTFEVKTDDIKR
jgi:hypothetical protein